MPRAPALRPWGTIILNLEAELHVGDKELADRIGIKASTLRNLKLEVVRQPLHSTGERILAFYRLTKCIKVPV